jgi:hypothetical protein
LHIIATGKLGTLAFFSSSADIFFLPAAGRHCEARRVVAISLSQARQAVCAFETGLVWLCFLGLLRPVYLHKSFQNSYLCSSGLAEIGFVFSNGALSNVLFDLSFGVHSSYLGFRAWCPACRLSGTFELPAKGRQIGFVFQNQPRINTNEHGLSLTTKGTKNTKK